MQLPIASNTVTPGTGARPPATGTPGEYSAGNPLAVPPFLPTVMAAADLNQLFLEMLAVIGACTTPVITPSGADLTQLLQAIRGLIAAAPHGVFSASAGATGNWVCPAGVYSVSCRLIGAGAGGGSSASGGAGGGGGSGFTIDLVASVVPGTAYPYSVGASGAGGVGGVGAAGGGTTFLGRMAGGGVGGSAGAGGATGAGGSGGSASGVIAGDITFGATSGLAATSQGGLYMGGVGGASHFNTAAPGTLGAGVSQAGEGAGGSGGANGNNGGAGGNGFLHITW